MASRSNPVRSSCTALATSTLLILVIAGCAASRQPRGEVAESGFLRNYSQLEPGKDGQAKLVYINPQASWSRYTGLQFESVTLWPGKDGKLASLSPEDQQMLVDRLYKAVSDAVVAFASGSPRDSNVFYGADNDGIGLAPFYQFADLISSETQGKIDDAYAAMADGSLNPCMPSDLCYGSATTGTEDLGN